MTTEDARIIVRYYLDDHHHHRREHMTRLAIIQIMLAMSTLMRLLPVPAYQPFEHYLWLGKMRARGATVITRPPC